MAFYGYEEDEVWKCLKHPPKQRPRNGICAECLYDRLIALCPDCANVRPCACTTTRSSSSSSMSGGGGADVTLSCLIGDEDEEEEEPNNFRRSRSVAAPCLRPPVPGARSNSSIWSVFRTHKSKKRQEDDKKAAQEEAVDYEQRVVMRSRSVGVVAKGRGWYFPSPMRAFRHSKTSKVVQER